MEDVSPPLPEDPDNKGNKVISRTYSIAASDSEPPVNYQISSSTANQDLEFSLSNVEASSLPAQSVQYSLKKVRCEVVLCIPADL